MIPTSSAASESSTTSAVRVRAEKCPSDASEPSDGMDSKRGSRQSASSAGRSPRYWMLCKHAHVVFAQRMLFRVSPERLRDFWGGLRSDFLSKEVGDRRSKGRRNFEEGHCRRPACLIRL